LKTSFFPRARNWLGFLISDGVETAYHAGATDHIPEMADLKADVAFLPVSGRYVMGPESATRAADQIGAKVRVGTLVAGDRYVPVPGFSASP
jgi:L-ascorbate metabolism protein UlaG (beta-lactamase superfamily)